jgi:hypothetical protein
MRSSLEDVIKDLGLQFSAVRRQLDLVEYLVRGVAAPAALKLSKTQSNNMRVVAKAMSGFISTETRIAIQNGAIIIVAAFFEEAIRRLIRVCLVVASSRIKSFDGLNVAIQKSQIQSFATRFSEIKDPNDLFKIEFVSQIENMLACARKVEGYVILSSEIAKNKNNLRSSELSEICAKIGLRKVWEKIALRKEIQDNLGQFNPDHVLHEATSKLNEFIDARNSLMHLDPLATSYGKSWIEAQIAFLQAVTVSTAYVLDDHLGAA